MADLESRVDKLETKGSSIEVTVEKLSQKVDDFIAEMKDFKTEMRDRDNQRAAEIAELRQQHNADVKEINKKIDEKVENISKEIRGIAVATILGVGAIVIAVMGFSWAIFAPSNSAPVQIQQPPAPTAQIQTVP